jgi:hypothetical protein
VPSSNGGLLPYLPEDILLHKLWEVIVPAIWAFKSSDLFNTDWIPVTAVVITGLPGDVIPERD